MTDLQFVAVALADKRHYLSFPCEKGDCLASFLEITSRTWVPISIVAKIGPAAWIIRSEPLHAVPHGIQLVAAPE